jgi:hypothetical protein
MVTDGWAHSIQNVLRDRADLTRNTLDSPFSQKSAQTLIDVADFISRVGLDDPRLLALRFACPGSDIWIPGERAAAVLAGAGFGSEGVEPDDLLAEIVARSIEDLVAAHSEARNEQLAEAERARADALREAEAEKEQVAKERDEARTDLDAERAERRRLAVELKHVRGVVELKGIDEMNREAEAIEATASEVEGSL